MASTQHKPNVKPGRYQHYKGPFYEVIDLARHSENEAWHVVYRPLYGEGGLWIRPLEMFVETVQHDGQDVPRFQYVGEAVTSEALTET